MRGKGDGKNDYLKGNRQSKETKPISYGDLTKRYSEEIKGYKAFAEARRSARKWTQETAGIAYKAMNEYWKECWAHKEPMTVAGTMLAIGIDRNTWSKAKNGDLDYLLEEYIELHDIDNNKIFLDDNNIPWIQTDSEPVILISWSEIRQKADLMIQAQLERNCYTNRGNPAGSIFGLKAQFSWREDDTPQHLVQNLVIADSEQAKKMLEMLK